MSTYDSDRKFTRPAEHIKALNVGPIPQRIFDDMSKYNDTSRGTFSVNVSFLSSPHYLRIYVNLCGQDSASLGSSTP